MTIGELTPAQLRALKRRQTAVFMPEAVFAPGSTLAALRRRGIVVGRQPHAELTPEGEKLCKQIDRLR